MVFLQGLLKLIRSEEHVEQQPKAYMCLGMFIIFMYWTGHGTVLRELIMFFGVQNCAFFTPGPFLRNEWQIYLELVLHRSYASITLL